ncbi:MAG: hypothetical protein Q9165_000629 [Trypethelium subeluteriae]
MADAPSKEKPPSSSSSPTSSRPEPLRRPTQRLPAPTLFVGPPSRNASNTSLLLSTGTQPSPSHPTSSSNTTSTPSTALPSTSNLSSPPPFPSRQRSYLDRLYPPATETAGGLGLGVGGSSSGGMGSKPGLSHAQGSFLGEGHGHGHGYGLLDPAAKSAGHSAGGREAGKGVGGKQRLDSKEVTEAQWREMQNTLEEVELSATSGAHVFGTAHAEALERLRSAQVELARAWARGEGEEVGELGEKEKGRGKGASGKEVGESPQSKTGAGGRAGRERGGSNESEGTTSGGRSQLEEEAEADIVLARRRREANDRYFQRVNAGVLDVVAKLDEVADAMRGVEMESKEIWGDRDSIETGSVMS